jgi:hypothetical protein
MDGMSGVGWLSDHLLPPFVSSEVETRRRPTPSHAYLDFAGYERGLLFSVASSRSVVAQQNARGNPRAFCILQCPGNQPFATLAMA